MYAGVDIGGTKTLVAAIDDNGVIVKTIKFSTPQDYSAFLDQLKEATTALGEIDFRAGCIAVPGKVDRTRGLALRFGNLKWKPMPLQADAERIFNCPMLLEHDSALGGLSESKLLPADKLVLYITISTGIGTGLIDHQHIIQSLADSEGGQMLLEYHGKRMKWESFASGHAIVERFGKKAADITDTTTWRRIAHDLAQGFIELIAVTQPDIIVVGGSVGRYLDRFKEPLVEEIRQYHNPLVPMPEIRGAARPDEAVVYGCYDFAREHYGPHT